MKAVLISIQPKWCELIASGKKTVEARKTKPKLETPFKCYIYCTKDNTFAEKTLRGFDENGKAIYYKANKGKVIGEFVCNDIYHYRYTKPFLYYGKKMYHTNEHCTKACLSWQELEDYLGNKDGYGWFISDLVIYDEPMDLGDFKLPCDNENDCGTCKRAIYCSSTRRFCRCDLEDGLKRPPQSWCYVERSNENAE